MMTNKAFFVGGFGFGAFLAEELSNFVVDDGLLGFEVVTTFVDFAMAFGADENFQALVDFFGRDFAELRETYVAV
jgi:hypothetical protein